MSSRSIMQKGAFAPSAVAPRASLRQARVAWAPVCQAAPKNQGQKEGGGLMFVRTAATTFVAAVLLQGGPVSASLLNLPDDVQARCPLEAKVEEAGRKVPSIEDLAQGKAPIVPGREFTPPQSLSEQLGSAKASGKLDLPDPLKTMQSPDSPGAIVVGKLQEQVREQLAKTGEAVQENLPGLQDLTPGALRDRVVGQALTPESPAVQMQR